MKPDIQQMINDFDMDVESVEKLTQEIDGLKAHHDQIKYKFMDYQGSQTDAKEL